MSIWDSSYNTEHALLAVVRDTPVNMVSGFKEGVGRALRKCRHCMAIASQIQMKVQKVLLYPPENKPPPLFDPKVLTQVFSPRK